MHPLAKLSRVSAQDNFHSVLQAVTTPNFGICPVLCPDDQLVGAITDGDLRRALLQHGADALELNAEQLMSAHPKTISPELRALDAINLMEQFKITAVFVQCSTTKKLLGLLRLHDLLEGKVV
jgi:arabinose-5-phosphate isomerase